MNYNLAKKLKEAGFPQDSEIGYKSETEQLNDNWDVAIPSLSELIEACGERFGSLHSTFTSGINQGWLAMSRGVAELTGILPRKALDEKGSGDGPEEAVANLWLELQNKNG